MLMKKFLLTTFMAVTTIVAMAQTKSYTDNLVVTIDGESSDPQETTIVVEQNTCYTDNLVVTIDSDSSDPQETTIAVKQSTNGTYTLSLNNFVLGGMIQVGNIVVDNITATETNGVKNFTVNRNINITAGEGNADDWLGPDLGEVPVNLTGKMDAANLYCSIDITMEGLGVINVVFGDEDSATSIENIAVANGTKRIFDITGREVKEITAPGIYIVNGKKIFVK